MASKKTFALGCFVGFLLGTVGLGLAAFGSTMVFRSLYMQNMASNLKPPVITTGAQADYSLKLKKLTGEPVDFAATKGKTVFLNFWSPNCPSCESELPAIEQLWRQTSAFGVEFLCVALDDPPRVLDLVNQYGLTFPIVMLEGKRPPIFDSDSAPLTFLISPNGDIALRVAGGAKWDDISAAAVIKLLTTSTPPEAK